MENDVEITWATIWNDGGDVFDALAELAEGDRVYLDITDNRANLDPTVSVTSIEETDTEKIIEFDDGTYQVTLKPEEQDYALVTPRTAMGSPQDTPNGEIERIERIPARYVEDGWWRYVVTLYMEVLDLEPKVVVEGKHEEDAQRRAQRRRDHSIVREVRRVEPVTLPTDEEEEG